MPLVERRYAEALAGLTGKNIMLDELESQLQSIVEVYNNEEELRLLLLNPRHRLEVKKDVIRKLFEGKTNNLLLNFLLLILDKQRIKHLPGILEEFKAIADKMRNQLNITIISAAPLEEGQISKIKSKYQADYGAKSVSAEVVIDHSVIGGVKVQIGDNVIDSTIKGRLEELKKMLVKV